MVIQHPVTTEPDNRRHLEATFRALADLDIPVVWFWPNPDAGTGEMAETLRHFREHHEAAIERVRFITDLPADQFIALLKRASCLVGNSSAGIKECSYLGTPVVDIGVRQSGRLSTENVMRVGYDAGDIRAAVRAQLGHGPYVPVQRLPSSGREPVHRRRAGERSALYTEALPRNRHRRREREIDMTAHLPIGSRDIGPGSPCFVIAEAGINHNGDAGLAAELVDRAAEAGADAIKFQTHFPEHEMLRGGDDRRVRWRVAVRSAHADRAVPGGALRAGGACGSQGDHVPLNAVFA